MSQRVPEPRHTILLFCKLCGNRTSRDPDTGVERDMVFQVTDAELAILRADLEDTTCMFCDAAMGLRMLESGGSSVGT